MSKEQERQADQEQMQEPTPQRLGWQIWPAPATEQTRKIPPPTEGWQAARLVENQGRRVSPEAAEPTRKLPPRELHTPRPSTPAQWGETPLIPPRGPTPPASSPSLVPPPGGRIPEKRAIPWAGILLGISLTMLGLFVLAMVGLTAGYLVLAAQLPPVDELRQRQPDFASSQIFDRNGNPLYEVSDPTAGMRTYVPIGQIDRDLQLATVATEDRNFYAHVGFDPIAILRAVYYALQEQEIVSGASTITQQVARNILLDPEERTAYRASRKIKEIILAAEMTRKYSKDEILEIYLNNNNYGNRAYGVDAAARTYFGTRASDLTVGQAAFLAGLPQSPATYDPYHGGRDAALKRHRTVLALMAEDGFITAEAAERAALELDTYEFPFLYTDRIPAPHFVFYVRQWVEEHLGASSLYQGSGLRIHTTLEPRLQSIAEEEVAAGIANLAERHATNGALLAIEPATGHILAMVGSVDFYSEEIDGQVNVTTRCRQPGSAIKPLTYLAAFEQGWTPATTLWDLPVTYTDTAGNLYEPVNYDGRFRGPVPLRASLANSLNIPAVKALDYVTVERLLELSERLGATSIVSPQLECPDYPAENRPLYGLALTLGGGELQPLELAGAYATFANGGLQMPATPILWIENNAGEVLVDNREPHGAQVISAQDAYLLTDILSDRQARCPSFGCPNMLELPDRPAAAKTGTTNDFRDAWTVGYTPDLVAGVWVGNNDNSEMNHVPGSMGAAPIWNAFMSRALENTPPRNFPRPQGIVEKEVCALSGAEPSAYCPERRRDSFSQANLPPGATHDWFQRVELDNYTGKLVNQFCRTNTTEKVMLVLDGVQDADGRAWLRQWAAEHGYEVSPLEYCTASAESEQVRLLRPPAGTKVYGAVEIFGTVTLENLDRFEITYGFSEHPEAWGWVGGPYTTPVDNEKLALWNTEGLELHNYTLRLVAYTTDNQQFEDRLVVKVVGPTPTPTLTPSSTPTETPTPSATPTLEWTATATLTPLPTYTGTPEPAPETATPIPSATSPLPPSATPTTEPPVISPLPTPTPGD
ncbi:MAG: transglycosylase domain-containing protein [Chloroflexota bacterium]|nr:transglycosylase domain-containing protein [Chloroflexota bacterium]